MAITAFTGPPGAGKSHALVKDVIIPAVIAGRRVISNIDGLNPDAIRGYCLERVSDARTLGHVVVCHGDDMLKPGFFPDEATPDTETTVKGGDLLVVDEWALYFPSRGNPPGGCNVEAFLRWHRHLTAPNGQATDVAIGTQVPSDINLKYRALIARSYKFKKLTALGAEGTYSWLLFDGHLQPKGGHYKNGTGRYDPEVFPLYASSSAAKEGTHVELRTNKKDSIWSGWKAKAFLVAVPLLAISGIGGLWWSWSAMAGTPGPNPAETATGAPAGLHGAPSPVPAAPPPSPWRIVGHIDGDDGVRVIVSDEKQAVRILRPDGCSFDQGRPVSCAVDGRTAIAEERLPVGGGAMGSMLDGITAR